MHRRCQKIISLTSMRNARVGHHNPASRCTPFFCQTVPSLVRSKKLKPWQKKRSGSPIPQNHPDSRSLIYHIRGRIHLARGEVAAAVAIMEKAWRISASISRSSRCILSQRLGSPSYISRPGNIDAALRVISLPEKLDVPEKANTYRRHYSFLGAGARLSDVRSARAVVKDSQACASACRGAWCMLVYSRHTP